MAWPVGAPHVTHIDSGTWNSIGLIRLALSPAWNDTPAEAGNVEVKTRWNR